jgi:hypothetical protein
MLNKYLYSYQFSEYHDVTIEKEEIVLGFLFGITAKEIKVVHPNSFLEFKDRNYIKGVWNFRLNRDGNNTILSTETRVFCPTIISKIFFGIYWFLISYFSGVTRMAILKLIKQEAELQKNGCRDRKEPHSSSLPHPAASASGGLRGSVDQAKVQLQGNESPSDYYSVSCPLAGDKDDTVGGIAHKAQSTLFNLFIKLVQNDVR